MVLLVLFPDAEPALGVLGFVCLGFDFHGELALDDLEPDLARLALDLGRVELNLSKLMCIVDTEEDGADGIVGEVADTFKLSDVLYACQGGKLHEGFGRHLGLGIDFEGRLIF